MTPSGFLPDFLTNADIEEIRAAMGGLHNTFFKTTVTYYLNKGTLSKWNEDRKDDSTYEVHNLVGLVEYGMFRNDEFVLTTDGNTDSALLRITFNVDYLDSMGLWDSVNNVSLFTKEGGDKIFTEGREYRTTQLSNDGPLQARDILVVIFSEPATRLAK